MVVALCGLFPLSVLSQCESGDTRLRRAKFYTGPELDAQAVVFKEHFVYDPDGVQNGDDPKEITLTKTSIPWEDLLAAEVVVKTAVDKPVRGIYIHYGMDGDKFKPVFQFLYPDDAQRGDLKLYVDKYFHVDATDGKLKEIPFIDCKKYLEDYVATVNVIREKGASPSVINPDEDPIAEWFSYPDNVNSLYAANKDVSVTDPRLVVNCISEQLCNAEMLGVLQQSPDPQFRHLLALNIANGNTDLLDSVLATRPNFYKGMAMDLGHLCPPLCK